MRDLLTSDRIEVYASGQNECSLFGNFSLTKSIVLDMYFNFSTYQEVFFSSVTSNASFISVLKLFSQITGSPSAICVGSGFRGHLVEFGRNILELLVYYLMLNKCKNLKDIKSSCLSVCTSSLYDNEGRYFLNYYM